MGILPQDFYKKINIVSTIAEYFEYNVRELKFECNESWIIECYKNKNNYYTDKYYISIDWGNLEKIKGSEKGKTNFYEGFTFSKVFNNDNYYCLIIKNEIVCYFYKDDRGDFNLIDKLDDININFIDDSKCTEPKKDYRK